MKKIITALVASTMLMGFTAPSFAGINPANIDESSSAANIYKVIDKKIAKGTNAGVVSIFAWAHINGEIYSVALSELRKHSNPSKAFAKLIGEMVSADRVAAIKAGAASQITETQAQITEVVQSIITVDAAGLADAQAEITRLNDRIAFLEDLRDANAETISNLMGDYARGFTAGVNSVTYVYSDSIVRGQLAVDRAYTQGFSDGQGSVQLQDPTATINGNNVEISSTITVDGAVTNTRTLTFDASSLFNNGETGVSVTSVALTNGENPHVITDFTREHAAGIDSVVGTAQRLNLDVTLSNDEVVSLALNLERIVGPYGDLSIGLFAEGINTLATAQYDETTTEIYAGWWNDAEDWVEIRLDATLAFNAGVASVTPTFSDGTAMLTTVSSAILGSDNLWTWSSGLANSAKHDVTAALARDINNALAAAYAEGYDEGYVDGYNQGYSDALAGEDNEFE